MATFQARVSSPWRPQQAASARAASIVTAHTANQILSIVTVLAVEQPAAVTLAVVSDALACIRWRNARAEPKRDFAPGSVIRTWTGYQINVA